MPVEVNAILDMIADKIVDNVGKVMKTLLSTSDITRAGLVRYGLLQDDPTITPGGITALVHFEDPDDTSDSWRHGVVSGPGTTLGTFPPPYEIGGGEMWYRRFVLEVMQFYAPNVSRNTAKKISAVVISRAEFAVKNTDLEGMTDDFGEKAVQILVHSSINRQGGGDTEYIYRGKVWFQVLTEKSG